MRESESHIFFVESVTFFRRQEFLKVGLVIAEMLVRTQNRSTGVEFDQRKVSIIAVIFCHLLLCVNEGSYDMS